MRITLVIFGTKSHWIRMLFIRISAKRNRFLDKCEVWNPSRLLETNFPIKFPDISLKEQGVGFWAWKPFIILQTLHACEEGDIVIYNDVGRTDIKMFRTGFDPAVRWMAEQNQDCIPGVEIPWGGPMSQWTKRDAFILMDCDREDMWKSAPVQASFSIWRNTPEIRSFVQKWCRACSDRRIVSNDPNTCGMPNLPNFISHRHDQSVLSLLCRKAGIKPLAYGDGSTPPTFPEKSLEAWMIHGGEEIPSSIIGTGMRIAASLYSGIEHFIRKSFPRSGQAG